jgi:hypothetical protein
MARTLFLLVSASFHIAAGSVIAQEPSIADLKAMAPVLRSSDPDIRSIEVRGFFKVPDLGYMTFFAIYKAPDEKTLTSDKWALVLRDKRDGTPIVFASERRRFLYDCTNSTIHHVGKDAYPNVKIYADGEGLQSNFGTDIGSMAQPNMLIDIKSLLAGPSNGEKVERLGDQRYRLSMTEADGTSRVFFINLQNPIKYERIEEYLPGDTEPNRCVEKIIVNAQGGVAIPAFPTKDQLEKTGIDIREFPGDGPLPPIFMSLTEMRAIFGKLTLGRPEKERAPALPYLAGLDWKKIKEDDERFSRAIRSLIPAE